MASDVSSEIKRYTVSGSSSFVVDDDEVVKQVECECCGLREDCTQSYIAKVEGYYAGKWVCGLCSEAVKERIRQDPNMALHDALRFHRDFCQKFNNTTRLNPKLSLTYAMRDIAKRSSEKRNTSTKLARSTSCVPKIHL